MPSLRELLGASIVSGDYYDFFEALVKTVEPGDTPTDEQYNGVRDTRIRFLQGETERLRDELRQEMQTSEAAHLTIGRVMRECDKAQAEIGRLRKECEDWSRNYGSARARLIDGRAEIEKLRKDLCEERDTARLRLARWLDTHSQLVADAEIGRLVREMPFQTSLRRTYASLDGTPCWMTFRIVKGCWQYVAMSSNDPAEALSAIQEEGDAEA